MRKILPFLLLAFIMAAPFLSKAQAPVDYRDVAVIVNLKSVNSKAIGAYFAKKRNIPKQNMIYIKTDTTELISGGTFDTMRMMIRDSLKAHGIWNKLNYLVTTKGVPLRVSRNASCDFYGGYSIFDFNTMKCASVESELTLMPGADSVRIGQGDVVYSPKPGDTLLKEHKYTDANAHFSRNATGMYLVSRLDGLTAKDVFTLIDRSGPNLLVDKDSALFVLDNSPKLKGFKNLYPTFDSTYKLLKSRGWKLNFDSTKAWLINQRNVLGYVSWSFTDSAGKLAPYRGFSTGTTFLPGSIATTFYSFTAQSFSVKNVKDYHASTISQGLSGYMGSVNEPQDWGMSYIPKLFGLYTDTTTDRPYNIAEAFWASLTPISWMEVVSGDPKTSIITHIPAMPAPRVDTMTIVCRTTSRTLTAKNNLPGNYNWFKTDSASLKILGLPLDSTNPFFVGSGKTYTLKTTTSDAAGNYHITYVNENIKGAAYRQVDYQLVICTGVDENHETPANISLYPNPAKDEIRLNLSMERPQDVNLSLRDILGREVYTQTFSAVKNLDELIPLRGQARGVYYMTLTLNGEKIVKKIVVE